MKFFPRLSQKVNLVQFNFINYYNKSGSIIAPLHSR